jgi:hypothetical protein
MPLEIASQYVIQFAQRSKVEIFYVVCTLVLTGLVIAVLPQS